MVVKKDFRDTDSKIAQDSKAISSKDNLDNGRLGLLKGALSSNENDRGDAISQYAQAVRADGGDALNLNDRIKGDFLEYGNFLAEDPSNTPGDEDAAKEAVMGIASELFELDSRDMGNGVTAVTVPGLPKDPNRENFGTKLKEIATKLADQMFGKNNLVSKMLGSGKSSSAEENDLESGSEKEMDDGVGIDGDFNFIDDAFNGIETLLNRQKDLDDGKVGEKDGKKGVDQDSQKAQQDAIANRRAVGKHTARVLKLEEGQGLGGESRA